MRNQLFRVVAAGLVVFASVTSAAEGAAEDVRREKYRQLKLPELVRLANAEDALAQFELGTRFNYGHGAPKNTAQALVWLRRAAQAGNPDAQRLLAVKYYRGHDVPMDHDEAFLWARRLAEGGDASGQMMLGNMYANGEGGPRDLVHAYMWYDIAATTAQKSTGGVEMLQTVADLRDRTAALLLPAEEAEAQRLASDWWLRKQGVSLMPQPRQQAPGKSAAAQLAASQPVPAKPSVVAPAAGKPTAPQPPAAPAKPKVDKP